MIDKFFNILAKYSFLLLIFDVKKLGKDIVKIIRSSR